MCDWSSGYSQSEADARRARAHNCLDWSCIAPHAQTGSQRRIERELYLTIGGNGGRVYHDGGGVRCYNDTARCCRSTDRRRRARAAIGDRSIVILDESLSAQPTSRSDRAAGIVALQIAIDHLNFGIGDCTGRYAEEDRRVVVGLVSILRAIASNEGY